jgi:hypothetical protein
MPGEDNLSSRFDYLFEPLDVEESVDDAGKDQPSANRVFDDTPSPQSAAPVRMAFAAFVLGTLGVVAVVALLLVQQPNEPSGPVQLPLEPAPLSVTVAVPPSQAGSIPPPPAGAPSSSEAPKTIESVPTQRAVPESPQPAQMPTPRERQGDATNSPVTRVPISVAPESRAPFPNQGPRAGDNGDGGGGGGLLGGLL